MQEILASTHDAPLKTDSSQHVLAFQRSIAKVYQGAAQIFTDTSNELASTKEDLLCTSPELSTKQGPIANSKQQPTSIRVEWELLDTNQELVSAGKEVADREQDPASMEWELVTSGRDLLTSHSVRAESPIEVQGRQRDAGCVKNTQGWTWPQLQDCAQHVPKDKDSPAPRSNDELPDCWIEVSSANREGEFTQEVVVEAIRDGCEDRSAAHSRREESLVQGQLELERGPAT